MKNLYKKWQLVTTSVGINRAGCRRQLYPIMDKKDSKLHLDRPLQYISSSYNSVSAFLLLAAREAVFGIPLWTSPAQPATTQAVFGRTQVAEQLYACRN